VGVSHHAPARLRVHRFTRRHHGRFAFRRAVCLLGGAVFGLAVAAAATLVIFAAWGFLDWSLMILAER